MSGREASPTFFQIVCCQDMARYRASNLVMAHAAWPLR